MQEKIMFLLLNHQLFSFPLEEKSFYKKTEEKKNRETSEVKKKENQLFSMEFNEEFLKSFLKSF